MKNKFIVFLAALVGGWAAQTTAAQAGTLLPQTHPYQTQLRQFMATLKAADFQPAHQDLTVTAWEADAEEKFRTWLLAFGPPAVGRKRNHSSVMIQASQFTLGSIEGETAIMRPPAHPEPLVDLANWNYPGNPYFNSRPLRMRAFVLAALDMIMLDDLLEKGQPKDRPNQDQLGGAIGRFAYVYPGFRDVVPLEVRDAYLAGLKKLVRRALDHGPKIVPGRTQGMYTWPAPALGLAAQALGDPEISKEVESYARRLFTEEPLFRSAGYFPSGGSLDSFNGISISFAVWAALSTEWPSAREAIAKAYRLKTHLTLPEPNGALIGPSHMSSLTSADPVHDQWDGAFHERPWEAAMITDEAVCLTQLPDQAAIDAAPAAVVTEVNVRLHELAWLPSGREPAPWTLEPSGLLLNFGYQYYSKGFYARRVALEQRPEVVRLPVLREDHFVRTFSDEFVVAKTSTHAAIIHTGPIADAPDPDSGYGFGGGALSAFWTPAGGSMILGRGIGAWSPQYQKRFDAWRSLPTHAVFGITSDGKVFTSADIVKPETTIQSDEKSYTVTANGQVPQSRQGAGKLLAGTIDYARRFESTPAGVRVTTTLKGDGQDSIAELYETLPVFLREAGLQPKATPTEIEFEADDRWMPASDAYAEKVTAVRLTRFGGAVQITFDRPRRVKLAPADWVDNYMSRASCRNVLIDLLENADKPAALKDASVGYEIKAVKP